MRTLLVILAVSLAARTALAEPPGLTPSSDQGPPAAAQPISADDASVLANGEVGAGRWLLGVGLAAGFGFGTGPGAQGRWETGRIFAVGEGVSGIVVIVSVLATMGDCLDCSGDRAHRILEGAGLVYLGLRALEVVDALVGPINHNRRYRELARRNPELTNVSIAPYAMPSQRGGGGIAGIAVSF